MFSDIQRVLEQNKRSFLSLPNVVGLGVGYKIIKRHRTSDAALIIFVEKKLPLLELDANQIVPKNIGGILTDVVEIGRVRFLNRVSRQRPASPGVSIGHYQVSAGTFGAVVKETSSGEKMILSNNHVLANLTNGRDQRSRVGDPILQPGSYDGGTLKDQIATLERFVPLAREEEEPTCPFAQAFAKILNWVIKIFKPQYKVKVIKTEGTENTVDCALAKPLNIEDIKEDILEMGKVSGVNNVITGQKVKKSGRTSGYTEGSVIATDVSLRVPIGPGEYYLFSDQAVAEMEVLPGDSGSLIVDAENRAVGLLFAGSDNYTVFNKIQNVMDKLGVEF